MKIAHDASYWNFKLKAFLHDPPDKAIHIPGHEERANRLIEAFGLQETLRKDDYQLADIIASGMDRAILPGFSKDPLESGFIDFIDNCQLTHPTGRENPLSIALQAEEGRSFIDNISESIVSLIRGDLDGSDGKGGISEYFKGDEDTFSFIRFNYLFFLLRHRLSANNVGGLGGLWHRIPADTRMPDHSIWQHCGLVSALASCFRISGQGKASLMVFAITPVQDFVGRARKLRDFWTGSLILSWLAFEGIKAIIYELGPDHILYPSLHGQPFVQGLLAQWKMEDLGYFTKSHEGVASFPNKFVCLVPKGKEEWIANKIEEAISTRWLELGDATRKLIEKTIQREDLYLKAQFSRQLSSYWEYHWASCPLVTRQAKEEVFELLHEQTIKPVFNFMTESHNLLSKKQIRPTDDGAGQLYAVTHRASQTMLAAGKMHRLDKRPKEPGIKCDMFGDYEALRFSFNDGEDQNPPPSKDPFWKLLREKWRPETDFGKTERLCAIGLIKRIAYRVLKQMKHHPLAPFFEGAERFPSTTEMSMYSWWQNLIRKSKEDSELAMELSEFSTNPFVQRKQLAQWFHDINAPDEVRRQGRDITDVDERKRDAAKLIFARHPVDNIHRYYAVLMMDGDKMGSLVNGETLGATWKSVMHPALVQRLSGSFDKAYQSFWSRHFEHQRLISPAVHAAISEALGDFSLFSVPEIIRRHGGRLIYAGGDDVCAILPVANAIHAAREIRDHYGSGFIFVDRDGVSSPITAHSPWEPSPGKLAVYLGRAKKISISAGILIAHHKRSLGKVIKRAHELLDIAKEKGGRNCLALELDKRAGGGKIFMTKWDDVDDLGDDGTPILEHFLVLSRRMQTLEQTEMSTSLAYRIERLRDGISPLVKHPKLLVGFIQRQLERSGITKKLSENEREQIIENTARNISALIIHQARKRDEVTAEALVVANFIGHCRKDMEMKS